MTSTLLHTSPRGGTQGPVDQRPDLPLPRLMTVQRAARELSVSRMTIYELMKCGALKSVKIGASRRIVSASVEKVVNRGAACKPDTA